MAKKKTSKKPKSFSVADMPVVKIEGSSKSYSPSRELANAKKISEALVECMLDGDEVAFSDILAGHLAAVDKKALAEKTGLSRQTIYKAMSGNPTVKTVMKIVQGLKAS